MRTILYPLTFILCLSAAFAADWYVAPTIAPNPNDGVPLGLVAFTPGVDSVWVAQVGADGKYTYWKPYKKDFRIATHPVILGGGLWVQPDKHASPAEQLLKAYGVEYLNPISRDIAALRNIMARWRASPTLPWPPR